MKKVFISIILIIMVIVFFSPAALANDEGSFLLFGPKAIVTQLEDNTTTVAQINLSQQQAVVGKELDSSSEEKGTWGFMNLVFTVVTVTITMVLVILGWWNRWRRRDILLDNKYNESYQFWLRNKIMFRIISIFIALAAVIIFILTEDIFLPVAMCDKYAPLMMIMAVINIITALFSKYILKEFYPYEVREKKAS